MSAQSPRDDTSIRVPAVPPAVHDDPGEEERSANYGNNKKSKLKSQSASSSLSFFLTGFGPFGGVEDNPTTVIVQTLNEMMDTDDDDDDDDDTPPIDASGSILTETTSTTPHQHTKAALHHKLGNHTVHSLDVVHVSASGATQQVQQIISTIQHHLYNRSSIPRQGEEEHEPAQQQQQQQQHSSEHQQQQHRTTRNHKQHAVVLHFGVNPNQRSSNNKQPPMFQLEQHAYNEADFRIPDQNGFQPSKQPIDPSHPLSQRLSTDLNVKRMKDRLTQKGYEVGISGDAGRFVCNYIYYQSLRSVLTLQEEMRGGPAAAGHNDDGDDVGSDVEVEVHVLFVHVPSFEDIPKDTQVDFTLELLDSIEEAILAKDKKQRKQARKSAS